MSIEFLAQCQFSLTRLINLTNNRKNRNHLESEPNDQTTSNTLEESVTGGNTDQEQSTKHQIESLNTTSKHKVTGTVTHKPNESKAGVLATLMAKVGKSSSLSLNRASKESTERWVDLMFHAKYANVSLTKAYCQ